MRDKIVFVVTDSFIRYKDFIRENMLDDKRWRFCNDPQTLHGHENFDLIKISGYDRIYSEKLEMIGHIYMSNGKRGSGQ